MSDEEKDDIYEEFEDKVNMAPKALEDWLATDESRSAGQDAGDGESIGHKSGERIVAIKRKRKAELTDDDYAHMRKVNGYIARHTAQRPDEVEGSTWLHSLKNWGHDPTE